MYKKTFKNDEERDGEISKLRKWVEEAADNQVLIANRLGEASSTKQYEEKLETSKQLWLIDSGVVIIAMASAWFIYEYVNQYLCILPLVAAGWLAYTIVTDIREKTK